MKFAIPAVILLMLAAAGWYAYARSRRIPDRLEPLGPFELVTHTLRFTSGYNEGRIYHGTTENYGLLYRGRPFTIAGKSGMWGDSTETYEIFNSLITFPTAEPALVVNVGDAANSSFYYLVREKNGAADAEFLGQGSGGVSAEWLDPAPGVAPAVTDIALHRGKLEGGRLLLLGDVTVLDVDSLKAYPVRQHEGAYPNQFKPPIALSPDRSSFVRLGSGESPENRPLFIVYDFVGDSSYTVAVDRSVMRYNSWEEMDRAWFDHYFEWRSVAGGHDRLAARENVVPLAYQGQLNIDQYDSTYVEYNLLPVKPEMQEVVVGFIEKEFGGKRQPLAQYSTTPTLLVGSDTVNVLLHDDQVGVFMDRGKNPQVIRDIGARFDGVLKTGTYDKLFLP
jgi:hypothetical protein